MKTATIGKKSTEELSNLKDKKQRESKHDKTTRDHIAKEAVVRDSKYKYPEDCTTNEQKKAYRSEARRKLKKLVQELDLAQRGKIEIDPDKAAKDLLKAKKGYYKKDAETIIDNEKAYKALAADTQE